jgi:hypothetical protein
MNREEAKQLLELCRPGNTEDRQDPALTEAFALLESDAALKAWFDEQQAIDARISEHMQSVEVPAHLKASILAGMRLHEAHAPVQKKEGGNTQPTAPTAFPSSISAEKYLSSGAGSSGYPASRAWWQSPWTGIAALFVIMMVVFKPGAEQSTQPNNQPALAGLPPVIEFLSREIGSLKANQLQFDKRDTNPVELQSFLASSQAPSPQSIPECLDKMPTIGCVTFEYEGAQLSMICFKGGEVYHLITADKKNYPGHLPTEPEVFQYDKQAFRVWVDGEQVKIISVEGTTENLPEFI